MTTSRFAWTKFIGPKNVMVLAWRGPQMVRVEEVEAIDCASTISQISAGETYTRTTPEIFNLADTDWADLQQHLDADEAHAPACAIATFQNASILSPGVIMTSDGRIVSESLSNTKELKEFLPFARPVDSEAVHITLSRRTTQVRLHGPHVMLRQSFDINYGHWLIEGLARAGVVAHEMGVEGLNFIVSSYGDPIDRVYRESLALFGITDRQIVPMAWGAAVHVDHLIYPLPLAIHQYVKSPLVIRNLEELRGKVGPTKAPTRLYVSRNAYFKRRLLNENEILEVCRQHGFEVVCPETLSFEEQIRTFSAARTVVGSYGAALTNIVFSPRGGTLMALANEVMPDGFFWDLAALKNFHYVSLHGTSIPKEKEEKSIFKAELESFIHRMDEDFTIDPEDFALKLQAVLAKERL